VAPEPPVWVTLVCGIECHARPSAALAHLSARVKSVVTVSTSCVASFSNIFLSRTPCRKAVIIEASEMRGMVPPYLGEAGDESPKSLPGFLPHCMEMSLHAMLLISTSEVRYETCTKLFLGVDRPRGEVHEPGLGRPGQGYMKVACHHSSVSTSYRNAVT
jgi:hypothetical protein